MLDMLRTMQLIAPPSNSIVPAFKTRCRGKTRFPIMKSEHSKNLKNRLKRPPTEAAQKKSRR